MMGARMQQREPSAGSWRVSLALLALAVVSTWLVLAGLSLWMGELNQDEGWYLYSAGQIRAGRLPYRDFAFTQPPLLPLVYAAAWGIIERFGVAGGRVLTWLFGALALIPATWLAMRMGPRRARKLTAGVFLILAGINLYQVYFMTVVKTYALSGLFLTSGLLVLSYADRQHAFRAASLAGFLLACAAATRISFGVVLVAGLVYLALCRGRLRNWAWLDFLLGAGLGLAVMLVPFMALGREGFRFGVFEYHTLRDSGPWLMQLAYKVGCVTRLIQAYFPAVLIGVFLIVAALRRLACRNGEQSPTTTHEPETCGPPCYAGFIWAVVVAVALVHLLAPFPYDDYQVPVYLIFCMALAAAAARWWLAMEDRFGAGCADNARRARRLALLGGLWLASSLHAVSSPMVQQWFVAGRDRIWWQLREQSPMAQLQDMGRWVRELTLAEQGTELLTQDTYLAVEARLPVPRGLEMGPFSYYPDWLRERAEQIGVLNRDMLRELLVTATNAPIAALSGYSLAIRSPEVEKIKREDRRALEAVLKMEYVLLEQVPNFGQANTVLRIFRRKPAEKPPEPVETAEE